MMGLSNCNGTIYLKLCLECLKTTWHLGKTAKCWENGSSEAVEKRSGILDAISEGVQKLA